MAIPPIARESYQQAWLKAILKCSGRFPSCLKRLTGPYGSTPVSVFAGSKGPTGDAPADTLAVAESIARYPSYQPERIFALLDRFYPYPKGIEVVRSTPFLPYLTFAPSAWVFPLKFTGGGLSGPGKLMIDSQGNAWAADNFIVGMQNIDKIWAGGLSKLAPNGKPLSPSLRGFTSGGIGGPGFGLTLDANDNVWVTSFQAQTISKFDNTGNPLSPPGGWNFNGQLGQMQGTLREMNHLTLHGIAQ